MSVAEQVAGVGGDGGDDGARSMNASGGGLRRQYGWLPAIALLFAAMLCLSLPGAAKAAWLEASSTHFVVYADDSERDIREFAEDLEKFRSALEYISAGPPETPSPSNRVTIYVVGNERKVQRLYGEGSDYIGGFYIPRAGGSLAIVPKVSAGRRRLDISMITLLHEYSHHFLVSASDFPVPRWLSEGNAEFYASASFGRDGTLSVGMPAQQRAGELFYLEQVPVEELFDEELYRKNQRRGYDSFYGRSWLLYHYLIFSPERTGQMGEYLRLLTQGVPSPEAAASAFGEVEKLEKDLKAYLKQRTVTTLRLQPHMLKVGEVKIRALRDGEAKMMPLRIQSKRGVTSEQAAELLQDVRKVGADYPDDPAVQAALAEAEFDAGNDAEAIAAADAALAADSKNVDAYVQKGYAQFRMAEDADDREAAYKAAMQPFLALNRLENDHPLPLVYNFRSFVDRGEKPNKLAVEGLQRAVDLARFDLGLRMTLAYQQIRDGDYEQAKRNLAPIAYDPHGGGPMARSAQKLIARLDEGGPAVSDDELAALASDEEDIPSDEDPAGGSSGGETAVPD
jgi:tetratricopeptide (TPR) repeat protein